MSEQVGFVVVIEEVDEGMRMRVFIRERKVPLVCVREKSVIPCCPPID